MQNITTKTEGKNLIITIDYTQNQGKSKSGKSTIIASSLGNQPIATPEGKTIILGLNLYTKE